MVRKIYGRPSDVPLEDLDVNVAIWRILMNVTLKTVVHLGNDHDVNLRHVNSFRDSAGQFFGEPKVDHSSDRDYWYQPDWLLRFKVGIDTLVAQSRLSIRQCQGLCLFRVGAVFEENGTQSSGVLEETNSVVFRNQLLQRTESNWWKTHGVRVEDLLRIHDSGHPQWDSENDGRITVWSSGLQRLDHLHVNVQRHCMGCKGNEELRENNPKKSWRIRSKISSRSLVFPWTWSRKEVVRTAEKNAKFPKILSPNIPLYQCFEKKALKKQRRRKDNNTFHSKWWQCKVAPKNGHHRQSAQSLRSSDGFDKRITRWLKSSRETCGNRSDGTRKSYSTFLCSSAIQWWATGKPVVKLRAKISKSTRRPEVIQSVHRSKFEFERSWTILLCSSVTEWSEESIFMPRIHVASRWKGKLDKRTDRKRCTIRSCLGDKGLQDTRKIQRWSPSSIFIRRSEWTGLKSTSERQCRSKRKKELRGNPLQRRDQYWNRHQQAIGTWFRWNRENGSTLKWEDSRTRTVSRCQNSLLNDFNTWKLVEKKMPEFLMIELLRNARRSIRGFKMLVRRN